MLRKGLNESISKDYGHLLGKITIFLNDKTSLVSCNSSHIQAIKDWKYNESKMLH